MAPKNKSNISFDKKSSIYRGVTRQKWTGRYEAHLWDNSCPIEGHTRKGKQGGFDQEEKAARAYDLAALKYWGPSILTNFPIENYETELKEMKNMSKQGYIQSIRRSSNGFSRGRSAYRGVTRHHNKGRWQARIGKHDGNKDLYLGTFTSQEEAAEAYDIAAIKFKGENAVTNFDTSRYDVKAIMNSTLPVERKEKGARIEVEDKESNGDKYDFPSNMFGLRPTTITVESNGKISSRTDCIAPTAINWRTMATTHGLVMGGSSLPSHSSLEAFGNMLSLGTFTFCSPGQSSGLVRGVHENTMPDSNWITSSLQDSESAPSAGAACQPPIMFNIWGDTRMSKS
ncbi:hypothetical protein SUGI_0872150 [Cryptomeria japonica]|nr:hypothetical protein SUGI_0872150 [Cryptomeria japonica]